MKKRVFFDKYDCMKFISHLDMLRFIERILKKADIPVKYSQGFHPRPKISFGNPVPLGTEAFNELMDIELSEEITDDEFIKKISRVKILGFKVTKVETLKTKLSISDTYTDAIYQIDGSKEIIDRLKLLLERDSIIERKIKKGKVVERDLGIRIKNKRYLEDKIELELYNTSPNAFLCLAEIELKDVKIVKKGYVVK